MDPVQAPLPSSSRLPFQPAAGSQISILISESFEGFKVTATRQYAGNSIAGPPRPPLPPCCNGPAATDCARVTVAFGKLSEERLSQVVVWAGRTAAASSSGETFTIRWITRTPSRLCYFDRAQNASRHAAGIHLFQANEFGKNPAGDPQPEARRL